MRALLLSFTMIVFSAWGKQAEYNPPLEILEEERFAGWYVDGTMENSVAGAALPYMVDDQEDDSFEDDNQDLESQEIADENEDHLDVTEDTDINEEY